MADIGELVVRIKADAAQLERELKRVQGITQQSANSMKSSLAGLTGAFRGLVPALGAAAIVQFTRQAIDAAGRMQDLADRIGFAAGTLAALEAPLVTSGASLEDFAASVNLMNNQVGEAAKNAEGPAAQAFADLGLSISKLQQMTPEQQFYAVVQALSRMETQFQQTEAGRAIFGRGFAALIPLIKDSNGQLAEFVKRQEELGLAMGSEQIARLDELGDAFSRVGLKIRNELLTAINDAIQGFLGLFGVADDANAKQLESRIDTLKAKLGAPEASRPRNRLGQVTDTDESVRQQIAKMEGLLEVEKALEAQRAGRKAPGEGGTKTTPRARGGGGSSATKQATEETKELSAATEAFLSRAERAKEIYEETRTPLEKNNEMLAEATALYNDGLITLDTYTRYQEDLGRTLDDTGDKAVVNARLLKDSFADALESAMFDFENFGDAAGNILEGIARNIARTKIIDPLSSSAGGLFDSLLGGFGLGGGNSLSQSFGFATQGGYGPFQGFAEGGRPPVGVPSIVGERGPEIFVPDTRGTVIPNHALGGQTVSVSNSWHIGGGVTRQELASLIPYIESRTQASVLAAIERGGRAAAIVGRKS